MTYTKPELIQLAKAVAAIQGSLRKTAVFVDGDPAQPDIASSAAYEADE